MRALAVSLLASAAPLSLWGCGGDDTTAGPGPSPTPGGGAPSPPGAMGTVEAAWENHLGAFLDADVDRILKDYDEKSMISVYNDHCFPTTPDLTQPIPGLRRYIGLAGVRTFFTDLFAQLNETSGSPAVDTVGPKGLQADGTGGAPEIREPTRAIADANVFLTWRGNAAQRQLPRPIRLATDTFTWKNGEGDQANTRVIDHQTIVVTEEVGTAGACEAPTGVTWASQVTPPAEGVPLQDGWANHLDAFATQNLTSMMFDYTENSKIQVFDNRNLQSYAVYDDLEKIRGFFDALFTEINAEAIQDPLRSDVKIGVQDVDSRHNTVFLAWTSNSHPKATDTFIFEEGKITVQTIVVETSARAAQKALVV